VYEAQFGYIVLYFSCFIFYDVIADKAEFGCDYENVCSSDDHLKYSVRTYVFLNNVTKFFLCLIVTFPQCIKLCSTIQTQICAF